MSQPASSSRLTVAVIVRDAADLLETSLQSIRSIADEIVVADTGSTDATIDVAKRFGAKVVECEWQDDFSAARNFCLSHTTGNWILWLDAGDHVSPDHATRLRKQIDENSTVATAYVMYVEIPASGNCAAERMRKSGWLPSTP